MVDSTDLYLSVLVLGEIRQGIEKLQGPDPTQAAVLDGLMAATAKVMGMTFVTRNTTDVATTGVLLLNPFEPPR